MKYRLDFVTNSSSSSYICEICGEEEYAWDFPDWLRSCENEHRFCKDHLLEEPIQILIDGEMVETNCPICALQTYSQSEMVTYLLKTRKVPKEDVFAEIKKINKRRRKLYDNEYIDYVFQKFNLTEDFIMQEIREKFKTYDNYSSFLYS